MSREIVSSDWQLAISKASVVHVASLQFPVHFRQLAIQLFDPSDQVENDRGPGKVDAQVSPQPLHATKLNHRTSRHQRFICWTIERLNQALLHQPHNKGTPGTDSLGNDIEGQRFIEIKIACHDSLHTSRRSIAWWQCSNACVSENYAERKNECAKHQHLPPIDLHRSC